MAWATADRGDDQDVQEPAGFWDGDRDVFGVGVVVLGGEGSEDGQGEHGEGDEPVPGRPAADLVVVQAGLVLAGLEQFLDAPAAAGDPSQCA
jgi:hypothetical protein